MLIITWDEPKRIANIEARSLDSAMIRPAFFETAKVIAAKKGRYMAINRISGRAYAVIFKPLGTEAVSVISFRVAGRTERSIL